MHVPAKSVVAAKATFVPVEAAAGGASRKVSRSCGANGRRSVTPRRCASRPFASERKLATSGAHSPLPGARRFKVHCTKFTQRALPIRTSIEPFVSTGHRLVVVGHSQ